MAASSQQVRRAVLEAFRREHGSKLIPAMPTKFLRALLDAMEPTTAKNWLVAIRALTAHAITVDLIEQDPTLGIKLRRIERRRLPHMDRGSDRAVRVGASDRHAASGWRWRSGSSPASGAAMSSAWAASTCAATCSRSSNKRPGSRCCIPVHPELRDAARHGAADAVDLHHDAARPAVQRQGIHATVRRGLRRRRTAERVHVSRSAEGRLRGSRRRAAPCSRSRRLGSRDVERGREIHARPPTSCGWPARRWRARWRRRRERRKHCGELNAQAWRAG